MSGSNIFVIGHSKTGKSPLARRIAARLHYKVIGASEWVKRRYVPSEAAQADTGAYIAEITELSQRLLAENPDACVDFIRAQHDLAVGGYVVDGIRNPRDFSILFRPDIDLVFFLGFPDCPVNPTLFEARGVAAIRSVVGWMLDTGIANARRVTDYTIHAYRIDSLDSESACGAHDLEDAMERAVSWAIHNVIVRHGCPLTAHANLPPLRVWVESRLFYDDDPAHEGWTPCTLCGVSSYVGHAPSFTILTDAGALFSYVPANRLRHTDPATGPIVGRLELDALVYHDSRAGSIVATQYQTLLERGPVTAWFGPHGRRVARYFASVDWYAGNDLLHVLELDNGQIALLPSHKVMWGDEPLPDYRKLRHEWRLGR